MDSIVASVLPLLPLVGNHLVQLFLSLGLAFIAWKGRRDTNVRAFTLLLWAGLLDALRAPLGIYAMMALYSGGPTEYGRRMMLTNAPSWLLHMLAWGLLLAGLSGLIAELRRRATEARAQ